MEVIETCEDLIVMSQSEISVTVALRVRPLNDTEIQNDISNVINHSSCEPKVVIVSNRGFSFDHVFIEQPQNVVFEQLMTPILNKVLEGINCSVIAYGQTGTGKSYTMGTDPQVFGDPGNAGLIFRTAERIFGNNFGHNDLLSVSVSFIEIYNEEVFDLLASQPARLNVTGFQVHHLTNMEVGNVDDVGRFLRKGTANRHTRPTLLNSSSSRSHAIFTFKLRQNLSNTYLVSELHMVDLAGSERAKRTGTCGDAFQEAVCINKGLLELGNVIQRLSSGHHVPYRNSVLTSVLHGSLQARNMIAMIACVSPSNLDIAETINTLRFVEKAKKVVQTVEVNRIIKKFKEANPELAQHSKYVTPASNRKHPLHTFNHQYSSLPKKQPRKNCLPQNALESLHSVSPTCSVYSLNMEDALSSTLIDHGSLISPVAKKCFEKLEININEKLEKLVQTELRRQRRPKIYHSKLQNDIENQTPPSDNDATPATPYGRQTFFRKEFDAIRHEMREIVKSEIKSAVREQIKTPHLRKELFMEESVEAGTHSSLASSQQVCEDDLNYSRPFGRESTVVKNVHLRRSARLSCRKSEAYYQTTHHIGYSNIADDTNKDLLEKKKITPCKIASVRRSSRLSCRKLCTYSQEVYPITDTANVADVNIIGERVKIYDTISTPTILFPVSPNFDHVEIRSVGALKKRRFSRDIPNETDYLNSSVIEIQQKKSRRALRNSVLSSDNYDCQNENVDVVNESKPADNCKILSKGNKPSRKHVDNCFCNEISGEKRKLRKRMCTASASKSVDMNSEIEINKLQQSSRRPKKNLKGTKKTLSDKNAKTCKRDPLLKNHLDVDINVDVHKKHIARVLEHLNSDSSRQLEMLPTIGPKTAAIIFNYRILTGRMYTSVEDLKNVPGLNRNFHEKFILANLVM